MMSPRKARKEMVNEFREVMSSKYPDRATAHDLARELRVAHATASKLWDPESTKLPDSGTFKRIVRSLWKSSPETRKKLYECYNSMLFGDDDFQDEVPESASQQATTEFNAQKFFEKFGLNKSQLPVLTRAQLLWVGGAISGDRGAIGKIDLTEDVLRTVHRRCCVVRDTASDGQPWERLCFFGCFGFKQEIRSSLIISLTEKTRFTKYHWHAEALQVYFCLSGRIEVGKYDHPKAGTKQVSVLSAGQRAFVSCGWWHRAVAIEAGSTYISLCIPKDGEYVKDLQLMLMENNEPEKETWVLRNRTVVA